MKDSLSSRRNNVRLHDKVREVIYSLMSYEEKSNSPFDWNWWLKNTPQRILDENIFSNYCSIKSWQKSSQDIERPNLIYLNLRAGKKLKYLQLTTRCFKFFCKEAVILLPIDKWESHYLLTLEIYKEFVECEFLATHFEAADILFEYIFQNTKTQRHKFYLPYSITSKKAGEGKRRVFCNWVSGIKWTRT